VIRAAIFDAGGVLLERSDVLRRWDERLGLEPDTFLFTLYGGTDGTLLVGKVDTDDHWPVVGARLGLDPQQIREVRDELDAAVAVDERLASYLDGLRPRLRTAIVTNAWSHGRAELAAHGLDRLVDEVIVSAEVGVAKPDAAIFELALERLGVLAGETVFVDDTPGHCDAATALGIAAVLHVSTERTIAAVDALLGS
jgi:putative hydrolase of the HAD superfamily